MYISPIAFPPSTEEPIARANAAVDTSPLGHAPSGFVGSVSRDCGWQSQEENNYRQSQEENNYRQSQEENCPSRLDFARAEDAVLRALGLNDEDSRCPLPGHDGIAWFEVNAGGRGARFVCDCLGKTAEWGDPNVWRSNYDRSLADAYQAIWTGRVIERDSEAMTNGARFVWTLLLAHETGLLVPAHVELSELPRKATECDHRAREFFKLLAGLRLARMIESDALPMPFSDRLVSAYLRVDRKEARNAINALRAYGVVTVTGRARERGPYLFAPGRAMA